MKIYLIVRRYKKDASISVMVGSRTRMEYLHSFCTGKSYEDKLYSITWKGIEQIDFRGRGK